MSTIKLKPLEADEIVVHVPQGAGKRIRVEESRGDLPNEITVQVSKKRKPTASPVLGVIVK